MSAGEESSSLAVVGMAVRLPGGADLAGYWSAMADGRELLTRSQGVAHGAVPDGDRFDAAFFGYAPSEALLLDPQQRVFLECAWEALEHGGYPPGRTRELVGVYAGCGDTGHLDQLRAHRDRFPDVSELQLRLSSSSDFLTSRVAYKLDLAGPAVTIQTACSTSLVAVHIAAQALLAGDCDLALAGGITLHVPFPIEEAGEDGITSSDGHCRAFDEGADGTVASDGAGVVVLKRLAEAIADRDHIHAVILGSAVTNDGAAKVGFTAPSVAGQAAAIRAAHQVAEIASDSIGYLEAHGTATPVGDPIEVRALTKAFGTTGAARCLLGTAKTNIGHTDAAAGVLGLIRVILALRYELIPANPHFRRPNPALELDSSPFEVNATARPWPRADRPRRAGVNSLGLGGTNAHVVVEEPPLAEPSPGRSHQLLPLSARTPTALAALAGRLAVQLREDPPACLADAAWTLQTGRREFAHRGFVVATEPADAALALDGEHLTRALHTGQLSRDATEDEAVTGPVLLFPGQGGQHVGMGRELYAQEPVFTRVIDACAEAATAELGLDLRGVLFADRDDAGAAAAMATMTIGQPAVFAVEYALAQLWLSWGVRPSAVLGHSLGAYAAAAVAGVLSLPDAMTLVLERGRILDAVPSGAMLAVSLPAERVRGLIGADLSIAAINGPDQCVVAGAEDAIEALRARLAAEDLQAQRLHISSASHSHLVEPMLERYEKQVAGVQLHPPAIPLISDRTGSPVTAAQALDPAFWTVHLRQTVNFSAALDTVLAPSTVLLEVGPGRVLSGLARRHPAFGPGNTAVTSMPHPSDVVPGTEVLLTAAGVLWQAGVELDWAALHSGERRYRTPLPTYPFERTRFRLDGGEPDEAPADPPVERAMSPEARAVAGAFRTILGVAELPDNANFFELGGDSMLALRVVALLRREAGIELDVRTVFRAPTVAALAGVIAGRQPGHPVDAERPGEATRDRPDRWLLCRTRRPQAPLRMYCLPHSGGSSAEFLAWSDRLPDIEVVGVEPPGRGSRLDEQPYGSMAELVTGLVEQVHFRPPYVLFGHSLGAATAYELTVALRERGQPLPERLYLSAHEAPHVPRPVTALAELDDLELLSEVESQFGTLPPEAHTDPEWRSVILRGLRADLRIVQRYRRTQADPVPCPITVLGGAEDLIAEADLLAWRDCTTAAFEHHLIAGGHFYFREHLDDVLAVLAAVRPA